MSKRRKLICCIAIVILVVVLTASYYSPKSYIATVTDKHVSSSLVFTETEKGLKTFSATDDIYDKLEYGKTYHIKSVGWDIPKVIHETIKECQ